MKPCPKNQKSIVWFAADALDARQARMLRAHLETCEGCRRYLKEISRVTERLTAAEPRPEIRASESFHHRVANRLRAETSASMWQTMTVHLRTTWLNWRVALPVAGAVAVVGAASFLFMRRPSVLLPEPIATVAVAPPRGPIDLDPTISNYRRVANRSWETLDELLSRQGNRSSPPTPIYTASMLPRTNELD